MRQHPGQLAQEEAGKLSGNRELAAKRTVERVAGKIQEKVGNVERQVWK